MTTTYLCICDGAALGRWVAHMDMAALSLRTITERQRIVRRFAEATGIPACAMTSENVTSWLRAMRNPSSRSTYFQALRAWSIFLVRDGYREDDPTLRVPHPKVPPAAPRSLPDESVHRALAGATLKTQAKILLGGLAGLRPCEVASTDGRDFRQVDGMKEVVGKGGVRDYVPIAPGIAALVELMPHTGPWFPSSLDPRRPMTANSLSTSVSQAFARAGVEGTAHRLRHWFATTMLAEGVDVRVVQRLLRHTSLASTARYTAVGHRLRVDAIATLPPLMPSLAPSPDLRPNAPSPPARVGLAA